jgi:hypothetical protein
MTTLKSGAPLGSLIALSLVTAVNKGSLAKDSKDSFKEEANGNLKKQNFRNFEDATLSPIDGRPVSTRDSRVSFNRNLASIGRTSESSNINIVDGVLAPKNPSTHSSSIESVDPSTHSHSIESVNSSTFEGLKDKTLEDAALVYMEARILPFVSNLDDLAPSFPDDMPKPPKTYPTNIVGTSKPLYVSIEKGISLGRLSNRSSLTGASSSTLASSDKVASFQPNDNLVAGIRSINVNDKETSISFLDKVASINNGYVLDSGESVPREAQGSYTTVKGTIIVGRGNIQDFPQDFTNDFYHRNPDAIALVSPNPLSGGEMEYGREHRGALGPFPFQDGKEVYDTESNSFRVILDELVATDRGAPFASSYPNGRKHQPGAENTTIFNDDTSKYVLGTVFRHPQVFFDDPTLVTELTLTTEAPEATGVGFELPSTMVNSASNINYSIGEVEQSIMESTTLDTHEDTLGAKRNFLSPHVVFNATDAPQKSFVEASSYPNRDKTLSESQRGGRLQNQDGRNMEEEIGLVEVDDANNVKNPKLGASFNIVEPFFGLSSLGWC